jgi:hypothetical protein
VEAYPGILELWNAGKALVMKEALVKPYITYANIPSDTKALNLFLIIPNSR